MKPKNSKIWIEPLPIDLESDSLNYSTNKSSTPLLALGLKRNLKGKNQRIVVSGDSDFMSNGEIRRFNLTNRNSRYTTQLFRWLSNDQFPIDISRKEPTDNKINIEQQGIWYLKLFFMLILPVTIGIAGTVLLIKRKRN